MKKKDRFEDRRSSTRFDLHLPVVLRHQGKILEANMVNLSCGGVCLQTNHADLEFSGNVEVMLDLNEQYKDVALTGWIVWSAGEKEQTLGIQFTNQYSLN